MNENLKYMQTFNENNLPGLVTTVLGALELFSNEGLPNIKIPNYKKPVVMGSGNAKVTGQILYGDTDAVFADENNFKEAIKRGGVDGAIIFSASGEKHATIVSKYYKSKGIPTTLVTCNSNSFRSAIAFGYNQIDKLSFLVLNSIILQFSIFSLKVLLRGVMLKLSLGRFIISSILP